MDSNTLARSMRFSVAEGGLATAMTSLFSGIFLTGFALAIGASDVQIGLLMTLPSVCGVMQLAGSYWIERFGQTRSFCLWTTAAARALYVPMLLIALFASGLSPQTRVWCIVAVMTFSSILASLGGLAWLSWTRALVPERMRVSYFGRRNMVNSALSFALCLAGGVVVERCGGGHEGNIGGFLLVFAVATGCGFASSALLAQIPDGAAIALQQNRKPWLSMLAAPFREANFRRIMLFYMAWNLAANLAIPFFTVFYMRNLGLPVWYIVALNTLTSLSGLAANNFWTRMADRFGMKPIVLLATLGDALYPLCLVFVGANGIWALLLIHFYGLFNTPITIGADNLILKLSPDRNNSSYIAVFKAVVGLAAMLAAVLGGWLAQSPLLGATAGTTAMVSGLKVVFLISFLGRIASLFLLAGVAEPGAQPVLEVALAWAQAWQRPRPVPQWFYNAAPLAGGLYPNHHATEIATIPQNVAVGFPLVEMRKPR